MSEAKPSSNYYELLGVLPGASVQDVRRAYRELSKLYHPDTTELPAAIATEKFQILNEAYATLSSPDRRASYDLRNGYSRIRVMRPDLAPDLASNPGSGNGASSTPSQRYRSSAYLDPIDRPLSAGELFALFILGLTFVACLLLVVTLSITRGDIAIRAIPEVSFPDVSLPEVSLPELSLPEVSLPEIPALAPMRQILDPSRSADPAPPSPPPSPPEEELPPVGQVPPLDGSAASQTRPDPSPERLPTPALQGA